MHTLKDMMYTYNRNFFLVTLLVVVLPSCGALNKKNANHLLATTNSKYFRIVSIDASGKTVSDHHILQTLQQNINQLSVYPKVNKSVITLAKSSKIVSGIDTIIANKNYIKIQYLNGRVSASGKSQLTRATANLKVEIKKNNSSRFKTVTIYPPKLLYISSAGKNIGGMSTLDTPDNLQKDIEHIFKNINLTMQRPMIVTGQLNISANSAAIFSDFERKLGLQLNSSINDKNMLFGIFNLKSSFRKAIIPLRIKLYKKTNGSKLKYEFGLNYIIRDNGTTTFKRQEVDYLVSIIRNISTLRHIDKTISKIKTPIKKSNYKKVVKKPVKNPIVKNNSQKTKLTAIKPKQTIKTLKVKNLSIKKKSASIKTQEPKSKSSNLKNIEYIEKMLSSLKEMRPSK